jgi:hypothetical protein
MTVRDEVVAVLQSRPRQEGGADDAGVDINNLRAAVRELQDAVIRLAEEIDRDRADDR